MSREDRLDILRRMRGGDFVSVRGVLEDQVLPAEQELLSRLSEVSKAKASFAVEDRGLIDRLLDTIISGQIFDLERFPGEDAESLTALSEEAELDRYTYLVAGCVGEFWTRMCGLHLPALKGWDSDETLSTGHALGQGLQLVNVLRDIPGTCALEGATFRRRLPRTCSTLAGSQRSSRSIPGSSSGQPGILKPGGATPFPSRLPVESAARVRVAHLDRAGNARASAAGQPARPRPGHHGGPMEDEPAPCPVLPAVPQQQPIGSFLPGQAGQGPRARSKHRAPLPPAAHPLRLECRGRDS